MRITRIEPQKNRPDRSNIYADGKFIAGVSRETLLRLALRTGDEIGVDVVKALEQTEEILSAKNAALRFLSIRPRTIREVRDKLREKEFADGEISRAIQDLVDTGLLNDTEFARMYLRDALTIRPAGKMLLRRKLLLLGVDKTTVDECLEEAFRDVDQVQEIRKIGEQFLRRSRATKKSAEDPLKLRNRLTGFLLRRGYAWDAIEPALKTLLKKRDDSE